MREVIVFLLLSAGQILCVRQTSGKSINEPPVRRTVCWDKSGPPIISAQCPRSTVLQIVRAGLRVARGISSEDCDYDPGDCGCDYGDRGCEMPDVQGTCMMKNHCQLPVVQQYLHTNTCDGFTTYMFLEFNCLPEPNQPSHDICQSSSTNETSGFIRSPGYPKSLSSQGHLCQCTLSTTRNSIIGITSLDRLRDNSSGATCQQEGKLDDMGTLKCEHGRKRDDKGTSKEETIKSRLRLTFSTMTTGNNSDVQFWIQYNADPPSSVHVECKALLKPTASPSLSSLQTTTTEKPTRPMTQHTAKSSVHKTNHTKTEIATEKTNNKISKNLSHQPTGKKAKGPLNALNSLIEKYRKSDESIRIHANYNNTVLKRKKATTIQRRGHQNMNVARTSKKNMNHYSKQAIINAKKQPIRRIRYTGQQIIPNKQVTRRVELPSKESKPLWKYPIEDNKRWQKNSKEKLRINRYFIRNNFHPTLERYQNKQHPKRMFARRKTRRLLRKNLPNQRIEKQPPLNVHVLNNIGTNNRQNRRKTNIFADVASQRRLNEHVSHNVMVEEYVRDLPANDISEIAKKKQKLINEANMINGRLKTKPAASESIEIVNNNNDMKQVVYRRKTMLSTQNEYQQMQLGDGYSVGDNEHGQHHSPPYDEHIVGGNVNRQMYGRNKEIHAEYDIRNRRLSNANRKWSNRQGNDHFMIQNNRDNKMNYKYKLQLTPQRARYMDNRQSQKSVLLNRTHARYKTAEFKPLVLNPDPYLSKTVLPKKHTTAGKSYRLKPQNVLYQIPSNNRYMKPIHHIEPHVQTDRKRYQFMARPLSPDQQVYNRFHEMSKPIREQYRSQLESMRDIKLRPSNRFQEKQVLAMSKQNMPKDKRLQSGNNAKLRTATRKNKQIGIYKYDTKKQLHRPIKMGTTRVLNTKRNNQLPNRLNMDIAQNEDSLAAKTMKTDYATEWQDVLATSHETNRPNNKDRNDSSNQLYNNIRIVQEEIEELHLITAPEDVTDTNIDISYSSSTDKAGHALKPTEPSTSEQKAAPLTVTIISAAVSGGVLIVIILAILIYFAQKRRDPRSQAIRKHQAQQNALRMKAHLQRNMHERTHS